MHAEARSSASKRGMERVSVKGCAQVVVVVVIVTVVVIVVVVAVVVVFVAFVDNVVVVFNKDVNKKV